MTTWVTPTPRSQSRISTSSPCVVRKVRHVRLTVALSCRRTAATSTSLPMSIAPQRGCNICITHLLRHRRGTRGSREYWETGSGSASGSSVRCRGYPPPRYRRALRGPWHHWLVLDGSPGHTRSRAQPHHSNEPACEPMPTRALCSVSSRPVARSAVKHSVRTELRVQYTGLDLDNLRFRF